MELTIHDYKLAQRVINEQSKTGLLVDGAFGAKSKQALRTWQGQQSLPVTGQLDSNSWSRMLVYISKRFVTIDDIVLAADKAGIPRSMLLAFWEVESVGAGFLNSGKCVILFEGHKFYEYVSTRISPRQAQAWASKYPSLCYKGWSSQFYKGGEAEWDRFEAARALDANCAMLSTSWGLFQLMGFNYAYGGYASVQDMVQEHMKSEHAHLEAIVNYIDRYKVGASVRARIGFAGLKEAIKAKSFTASAYIYNGSGYAQHGYHTRLQKAQTKWAYMDK